MFNSVIISPEIENRLHIHLIRKDSQEDLCFALWRSSIGKVRRTGLVFEIILPKETERSIHGNASFQYKYFKRALAIAREKKSGLAFIHSHPVPGWQDMSKDDINTEKELANKTFGHTKQPLLGLTVGTDKSWSARFWDKIYDVKTKYIRIDCQTVIRLTQSKLYITRNPKKHLPMKNIQELRKTISSWGMKNQEKINGMHVAIVGLGSVGSIVAESLARMGIGKIKLIDYDRLQKHNLDRHLIGTKQDLGKFKVDIVAKRLKNIATSPNFKVHKVPYGINEKEGFDNALDCDLIFGCVDTDFARHILNTIAYRHMIPVIEGGIVIKPKKCQNGQIDDIEFADTGSHIIYPTKTCLLCIGQYDLENALSEEQIPYIEGEEREQNQNVFAFSLQLASIHISHFLSLILERPRVPSKIRFRFHRYKISNIDKECHPNCSFKNMKLEGNSQQFVFKHINNKAKKMRCFSTRIKIAYSFTKGVIDFFYEKNKNKF